MWLLLIIVSCAATYSLSFFRNRTAVCSMEWLDILARIKPLNRDMLYLLRSCEGVTSVSDPQNVWQTIGGVRGLIVLYRNVQAMLDLAVFAESWTGHIGLLLAELVRQDAIELRRAIVSLCMGYVLRRSGDRCRRGLGSVLYVYNSAGSRLVALYETTHAGLYPQVLMAIRG